MCIFCIVFQRSCAFSLSWEILNFPFFFFRSRVCHHSPFFSPSAWRRRRHRIPVWLHAKQKFFSFLLLDTLCVTVGCPAACWDPARQLVYGSLWILVKCVIPFRLSVRCELCFISCPVSSAVRQGIITAQCLITHTHSLLFAVRYKARTLQHNISYH